MGNLTNTVHKTFQDVLGMIQEKIKSNIEDP